MPEQNLLHALKEYSTLHGLVRPSDSVILAVSGGLDSVVLTDLFLQLRDEWNIRLVLAHFNHHLRGEESEGDEDFVRELCRERGLECYIENADTAAVASAERRSTLDTARQLRYRFLDNLRNSLQFHSIATAHHADDNLETVLFNLFRGTGVHGLTGIPRKRDDLGLIRPLLFAKRLDLDRYAAHRKLKWREDSSNAKTLYSRNFLRHKVIPLIRETINPNVTETIARTTEIFQDLEAYLRLRIDEILPGLILEDKTNELVLDRENLLSQPVFLQESILRHCVNRFTSGDADFLTVKALLKISAAEPGPGYPFPSNVVFTREQGRLVFRRYQSQSELHYPVELDQAYTFRGFSFSTQKAAKAEFVKDPHVEFIDADKLHAPLTLRTWHHGDRFVPLGMSSEKKVSDFFIDEKISIYEKESIPLLESAGVIVWICGKRLDDRFKVTPATEHILKLEYIPKSDGE